MPDGKSIISGWNDGKIRAHGPQTGKLLYTINNAHCCMGARKGAEDTVKFYVTASLPQWSNAPLFACNNFVFLVKLWSALFPSADLHCDTFWENKQSCISSRRTPSHLTCIEDYRIWHSAQISWKKLRAWVVQKSFRGVTAIASTSDSMRIVSGGIEGNVSIIEGHISTPITIFVNLRLSLVLN